MKSGFVAIVGRSNVGKSTLLNALIGTKIAAVSAKAQTTRHLIQGVYHDERGQIIFIDTPGIFKKAKSPLTNKLTQKIQEALKDIDCIIYLVDPTREIGDEEKWMQSLLTHTAVPIILAINKADLSKKERQFEEWYQDLAPKFSATIAISALKEQHLKSLITLVFEHLPEGEEWYEAVTKTNVDEYFWVAEVIREKIFNTMGEEIPYTTHVVVDAMEDKKDMMVIHARILTTEERYQRMLIGRGGQRIKEIGQTARKEIEVAINKKVFLELRVEVDPHWVERFE